MALGADDSTFSSLIPVRARPDSGAATSLLPPSSGQLELPDNEKNVILSTAQESWLAQHPSPVPTVTFQSFLKLVSPAWHLKATAYTVWQRPLSSWMLSFGNVGGACGLGSIIGYKQPQRVSLCHTGPPFSLIATPYGSYYGLLFSWAYRSFRFIIIIVIIIILGSHG